MPKKRAARLAVKAPGHLAGARAQPAPDPASGHETRARIVETAFRLFHEQGYNNTGVATILREAGVNAGSLYHFFASKDALLSGVLEYALTLLRPAVMDPVERRTDDPIERVFELLQQYRGGLFAWGCKMGCPIGNLALEVADDNPEARRLIHENFKNWTAVVREWLEAAGPRLPGDVDRSQLANFVLTVMEGGIMQARAAGDLAPFDASVAQLRSYFAALQRLGEQRGKTARQRTRSSGRSPVKRGDQKRKKL
jgi:AcrR family transcriptional regulator